MYVPEWLGQLTQLDLSENQLTSVPKSLGQLTQLTRLYRELVGSGIFEKREGLKAIRGIDNGELIT